MTQSRHYATRSEVLQSIHSNERKTVISQLAIYDAIVSVRKQIPLPHLSIILFRLLKVRVVQRSAKHGAVVASLTLQQIAELLGLSLERVRQACAAMEVTGGDLHAETGFRPRRDYGKSSYIRQRDPLRPKCPFCDIYLFLYKASLSMPMRLVCKKCKKVWCQHKDDPLMWGGWRRGDRPMGTGRLIQWQIPTPKPNLI